MKRRFAAAGMLVLGLILATGLTTQGQLPQPPADPELKQLGDRVTEFLERIGNDDIQDAYQDLLKNSQLITQTAAVDALEQKTQAIPQRYGAVRDFEQVSARRVGKDLVLMRYLYKCENYPLVWYFTYYRTGKRDSANWVLVTVRFDTNAELLALGE